ncbi:MAG: tetratricopeptide repeat protein [Deltaproteobacteria bacterium]|nr:tetratricopeptide repeat protein [Deltaproteobacteria bacterium]
MAYLRGLVEVVRGRWEEAIAFLERAIEYNPKNKSVLRALLIAYAHAGRVQEARAALDKVTEGWPATMKNLRFVMYMFPTKDLQVAERVAEYWLKAGIPGEPSGFYKISMEHKLTGKEIRKLFFGHKVTGIAFMTGKQWWVERTKDGKATIRGGDGSDTGKSWIEDDMLCDQWDKLYEGLKDCWPVYRNPEGTPEKNDEYLGVPDYGIYPFSPVE